MTYEVYIEAAARDLVGALDAYQNDAESLNHATAWQHWRAVRRAQHALRLALESQRANLRTLERSQDVAKGGD